jgi:hypothetical protein
VATTAVGLPSLSSGMSKLNVNGRPVSVLPFAVNVSCSTWWI